MSPLDDQLHDALHHRAATVHPPADPMAGIERRARGLRRRRLAAAVAGGAVLIAAVAFAVPALLPAGHSPSSGPATGPTTTVSQDALDPAHPWAMRGELSPSATSALRQAWSAQHPGSSLTPLFGQVYEPSARPEAAFVASGPDGDRYGYASVQGGSADLVVDEPLPPGTTALTFALAGDEVPRLLVVAADSAKDVSYSRDGAAYAAIARAPGVGITPLEGDTSRDRVRVTDSQGKVSYDAAAPDYTGGGLGAQPANLLSWPQRGVSNRGPQEADLLKAFADAMGRSADVTKAHYRELFLGDTGKGEGFTVGQAWFEGDRKAYSVSYTINVAPRGGSVFFIGPPTPANPVVLAFDVPNLDGMSDLLVVVPQPNTGQVLYDDNGAGAFRPITGQDQRNGVVLIDRSIHATNDRLQLLDGNGDMSHPTFEGPVAPLLCGLKECG